MNASTKQALATKRAAINVYFATLDAWQDDPTNTRLAEKHLQAYQNFIETQDAYERSRKRANWTRARRIIALAAKGRGQQYAERFANNMYQVNP